MNAVVVMSLITSEDRTQGQNWLPAFIGGPQSSFRARSCGPPFSHADAVSIIAWLAADPPYWSMLTSSQRDCSNTFGHLLNAHTMCVHASQQEQHPKRDACGPAMRRSGSHRARRVRGSSLLRVVRGYRATPRHVRACHPTAGGSGGRTHQPSEPGGVEPATERTRLVKGEAPGLRDAAVRALAVQGTPLKPEELSVTSILCGSARCGG
jgi:hypothetical protein